jgi:hypothetical protein
MADKALAGPKASQGFFCLTSRATNFALLAPQSFDHITISRHVFARISIDRTARVDKRR